MSYTGADRAQVESLGSLLLVAVVVVSAGTFGAYYVASATSGNAGGAAGSANGADLTLELSVTTDEVELSHNGGDSVSTDGLQINVENATGEYTYDFSDGRLRGDGDGQLDPGEQWRLAWSQAQNTEVTVSVVDDDGRVIFRGTATTESATTERPAELAGGEEVDGQLGSQDPESGETDGGDEEQSEPTEPTNPWLDTNDNGVFEPQAGDVNVSLSGGSIPDQYSQKASSSTLRVPAGVTVDAGNAEIKLDSAENVQIAGKLETKGQMTVQAPGYIDIDGGELDNSNGGGNSISLDSGGSLTATAATVRTKGQVTAASAGAMDLSDADFDNSQGSGNSISLDSEDTLTATGTTVTTKGQLAVASAGAMDVSSANLDNSQGGGNSVSLDSEAGLTATGTVVTTKGQITAASAGTMDVSNATLNNSKGGGNSISLDSEAGLTARTTTIQSKGQITAASAGAMDLSNTTIDNSQGGGNSVTLDSEDTLTAAGATATTKGKITATSENEMNLSGASFDNSKGGQNDIEFTVETSGNLSLVDAELRSEGNAIATVPEVERGDGEGDEESESEEDEERPENKYVVKIQNAVVEDADDRLKIVPEDAHTGTPASGGVSDD